MRSNRANEPRYPDLGVSTRSSNPLALVASVRSVLRQAGAGRAEIAGFTEEALADPRDLEHALEVARDWVGNAEAD